MSDTRHRWIVDAIDEEIATCEVDGIVVLRVPRWFLPESASVGAALVVRHHREGTASTLEIALAPMKPGMPDPDPGTSAGTGDIVL
jgi:hypothetical protein